MADLRTIEALKRRHGRRLLAVPGVCGVGIERGSGQDDYALVVHVVEDDAPTRAAVEELVDDDAVRVVRSGPFRAG